MVDIVITDNVLMVLFSSYKFPINEFISLITDKSVKQLCDCLQIQALGDRLDMILTFRGLIVVIHALEDEAQTFGGELNLGGFTPAKKIEHYLSELIILAHVVHCLSPVVKCSAQGFFMGRMFGTSLQLESVETGVLFLANGIAKVELGGKIPFVIVGIVTNVISMETEQCLI